MPLNHRRQQRGLNCSVDPGIRKETMPKPEVTPVLVIMLHRKHVIRKQRSAPQSSIPHRRFRPPVPRKRHHLLSQHLLKPEVHSRGLEPETLEIPEEHHEVPSVESVVCGGDVEEVDGVGRSCGDHCPEDWRAKPEVRGVGENVDRAGDAEVRHQTAVLVLRREGVAARVQL